MADIFVMRPRGAVLCSCGAEISPSEHPGLDRAGHPTVCPTCRESDSAANALVVRRALTELVADERGYALHRRVLPVSGSTVDHLFVGASAVFVMVDEHTSPDAEVVVERSGGRFTPLVETLAVDRRTRTDMVDAVQAQCREVAAGLAEHGHGDVPVIPVLSFVEAHLPRRARNRRIADVRLAGPATLADDVGGEGPFDGDRRFAVAMSLVSFLPSSVAPVRSEGRSA